MISYLILVLNRVIAYTEVRRRQSSDQQAKITLTTSNNAKDANAAIPLIGSPTRKSADKSNV
jgi:hypothetical protein